MSETTLNNYRKVFGDSSKDEYKSLRDLIINRDSTLSYVLEQATNSRTESVRKRFIDFLCIEYGIIEGLEKTVNNDAIALIHNQVLQTHKNNYQVSIISNTNGKPNSFKVGEIVQGRTYESDIKEIWEKINDDVVLMDIRHCQINILGKSKSLGRSDNALSISRKAVLELWKTRRIRITVFNTLGELIDITNSNGFDVAKAEALEENKSRAVWQYLAHKGIDRITAPIQYMLRENYSLKKAIINFMSLGYIFNRGRMSVKKTTIKPLVNDDKNRIVEKLLSYIVENSDEFSIPIYSKNEINEMLTVVETWLNQEPHIMTEKFNCWLCGEDLSKIPRRKDIKVCPYCEGRIEINKAEIISV